jgi:hypothetical protein
MRMRTRIIATSLLAALAIFAPLEAGIGSIGTRAVYPNPFTVGTTFQLSLPESGPIRIVVYDLLGKPVRVLFDGVHQAVLNYDIPWDGNDETGRPVEPGIYICSLFSKDVFVKSVKVVKVTN